MSPLPVEEEIAHKPYDKGEIPSVGGATSVTGSFGAVLLLEKEKTARVMRKKKTGTRKQSLFGPAGKKKVFA